jgi:hypothetical protein
MQQPYGVRTVLKSRAIVAVLAITLGLLAPATAGGSSASTVVVSPANMQGWSFFLESGSTGTGTLVTGPGSPPLGFGSARLTTPNSSDGMVLGKAAYQGVRLADITTLQYSTYRTAGGLAQAISLQFNIDNDLTDNDTGWKGRLVFEPYYTETVLTGQWQTWNAMTQGRWWATAFPMNSKCNINNPCTWAGVLNEFPNAGIHAVFGAVLLKAGSGWSGFDGNVDALTIGVKSGNSEVVTTYDFEPVSLIDIKPGSFPNSINPAGKGVIPVAILSVPAASFAPVTAVDRATLTFGATGGELSFTGRCDDAAGDLNGDGTPDLVCYFDTQKTGFTAASTTGTLKGKTTSGHPFAGTDSVRIVP